MWNLDPFITEHTRDVFKNFTMTEKAAQDLLNVKSLTNFFENNEKF